MANKGKIQQSLDSALNRKKQEIQRVMPGGQESANDTQRKSQQLASGQGSSRNTQLEPIKCA